MIVEELANLRTEMLLALRYAAGYAEAAAQTGDLGTRQRLHDKAEQLRGMAREIEAALGAALSAQPQPVCPHCFDRDDDDAHTFKTCDEGGVMVALCVCGEAYRAQTKTVKVWETRKI